MFSHRSRFTALATVVALTSAGGCGSSSSDGLPRRAIYGSVTLDGVPLSKGAISFDPAEPGSTGSVSAGAVILDGDYSIDRQQGPTPGKYHVSIRSVASSVADKGDSAAATKSAPGMPPRLKKGAKAKDQDQVPSKYNSNSELMADITVDGPSNFNYELKSK
ncbi:hypothetical protein [Singulisphaera sp. PoT]|uniref:hypothetical protein n=1 Tax=Singulisphaera sp. PoT TaxID=3411797 RepID=UPI003BF4DA5A